MNCSVAIQYLPLGVADDTEECRLVDAVIDYIASTGLPYVVGPFETTIEGPYDACMECLKNCQLVGAAAGCAQVITYAKINYKAEGDVLTTEDKIGKYRTATPKGAL